jgi:fosfomycin resistance protein FosX
MGGHCYRNLAYSGERYVAGARLPPVHFKIFRQRLEIVYGPITRICTRAGKEFLSFSHRNAVSYMEPLLEIKPMIQGLSHLTFIVRDLDKMAEIITEVLGGEEVYSSGDDTFSTSREKFFVAGGIWIAIMEGESLPTRTYNHVAFKVTDAQLDKARLAATKLGLDIRPPRPRVDGEGQSLYFHDHDNYLFELHTGTLEERLQRYAKV